VSSWDLFVVPAVRHAKPTFVAGHVIRTVVLFGVDDVFLRVSGNSDVPRLSKMLTFPLGSPRGFVLGPNSYDRRGFVGAQDEPVSRSTAFLNLKIEDPGG
jgi:hypothetical protein